MSQNKSFTQSDVFLLILCFYRFFGLICDGDFLSLKAPQPDLPPWSHVSRMGCGNKTIFSPALIGCFRRKMTSPDHLENISTLKQIDWNYYKRLNYTRALVQLVSTVTYYERPTSPFSSSRSVSRMFVVGLLLALEPLRHRSAPLSSAKETLERIHEL